MIVAFLLLYCYSAGAWKYVKKTIYNRLFGSQHDNESESLDTFRNWIFDLPPLDAVSSITEEKGIRFFPPVYEQRYWTVAEVLRKVASVTSIRKVADLGCSEMSFFHYLKHMEGVEEVVCVDVDEEILSRFASRTTPFTSDFLSRRSTPFKVTVLSGDASTPDRKLEGTNVVVAIELIEHLYPKTLEDLPYAVFGLIQPDLAVFTTPNCEFNVVFPNFSGFRHDDHKFEWSRQQFKDWGCNLIARYPDYEVFFKGIGPGPEGTEEFGLCSQMAVFLRKKTAPRKKENSHQFNDDYKVVQDTNYPVRVETRTEAEIILCEAEIFLKNALKHDEYLTNDRFEIPLSVVMKYVPDICTSDDMLREILLLANWKIEKLPNNEYAVILPETGMYSGSSSSYSDLNPPSDYHPNVTYEDERPEECWDSPWEGECTNDVSSGVEAESSWRAEAVGVRFRVRDEPSGIDRLVGAESACYQNGHSELEDEGHLRGNKFCHVESSLEHLAQPLVAGNDGSSVAESGFKSIPLAAVSPVSCQPVMRCHSFEQINKQGTNKNKTFRYSLCDEEKSSCVYDSVGAKNVVCSSEKESSFEEMLSGASCSDGVFLRLEDSCSQSKAGDSGYPNSCERDMDMDLTPEQVDEIVTESESSFEEGDDEESVHDGGDEQRGNPQRPPLHQVHWIDNMENGDVANNNRDWEGNNMEAEAQIGEALQFENLIDHRDFAVPLMDAVPPDVDSDEENRFVSASEFFNSSDDTLVGSQDSLTCDPERSPGKHYFDASTSPGSLERRMECSSDLSLVRTPVLRDLFCRSDSDHNAQEPSLEDEAEAPQEFPFPPWLLGIMPDLYEENDNAGGDEVQDIAPDNDAEEAVNEELIPTVEGDIKGGGEPAQNV